MDNRIPVTLLTGFLGSGKTTLLNKLLNHEGMKDTAVVINELGSTGLDHILSKHLERTVESQHIADNTVLLESGCLCCTLTNEMADTLRDLFFKRALGAIPEFKRLIIETTGLADPIPIMGSLLNEPVIGSTYRLDAVVVTVDSIYGIEQIAQHQEAKKQVAVADVLLLTKTDLASTEQIKNLQNALLELNPSASQFHIEHGNIEPASIIDVGLFNAEGQQFTTLKPGESFGEQAFLSGGIRGATAQALDEVTCLKISSEQANQMMAGTSPLLVPVFEALLLQLNMNNALRAGLP